MKFSRDVRTALDSYKVCVGQTALAFSSATHATSDNWAEWGTATFQWSVGDTVSLSIVASGASCPPVPVWSATLTAKQAHATQSTVNGCDNDISGAECSTTDNLTDDDFTVGGQSYSILHLSVDDLGYLFIEFDADVNTALKALKVCAGSTAVDIPDGTAVFGARWINPVDPTAVRWSAGDTVSLSIVPSSLSCPISVSLSVAPNPVPEGDVATITATLSSALTNAVTIPITHTAVTAETTDYIVASSVTISSGSTTGAGTIAAYQDDDEDHETLTVALGALPAGVVAGATPSLTIRITDDEDTTPIWSATLTAKDTGSSRGGCDNTITGAKCSSASVLTDDDFTVGGATYRIALLYTTSSGNNLEADFGSDARTALDSYKFCVGDRGFAFSDAGHTLNSWAAWAPSPALAISVDDTVRLSIVNSGVSCPAPPAPPSDSGPSGWLAVTVEPGDGSLALSWNRLAGPNHVYEVNWKTSSAADADATTPGNPSTGWVAPAQIISGTRNTQYAICCAWTIEGLSNGTAYDVRVRPLAYAGEAPALWAAGSGAPAPPAPPSTLTLSTDPAAIPHGGSVTVTARLDRPALSLMEVWFDTEGDGGGARWGPDCAWERGTSDMIAPGEQETTMKLCAVPAPAGVVWSATLTPGGGGGAVGCFGRTDCDALLTDNGFTVGGAAYHFGGIADTTGLGLSVEFNADPNAALRALKFCVGSTGYSIGSSYTQVLTSPALGWTVGVPVSLKIAASCATVARTMTVTAGVGGSLTAPGIPVRALGPNPPTAITLSADPQAAANGGPVTVTARLDRPTAPGVTVHLSLSGVGAASWGTCGGTAAGVWTLPSPLASYRRVEIPPGAREATAELCVRRSGGPRLVIGAWADAPRLEARDLSLLAPAGLALRSLTVDSTDPAETLPENSVRLSDAGNDYTFSVPRAVSSVTVKPAAYETTSVKVNGSAVDDTTPSVDVPLDVGDNTIRIEVRAPAVPAVREYTLTVTRMEASTDRETQVLERPECEADTGPLCGIALSAGSESVEFSPDFARDTTSYRATVPAGTTSVTLTPDYAEGTSVFAGSRNGGTTYTRPTRVRPSGTAVELALAPGGGSTELWLMVSGSGGMTTYRIDVTEAAPAPRGGVTVTPTTLSVAEDGSATYTVTLDSRPTADVTITIASGDDGAASVAPASYTFTPSGWNIAQTFVVSGVADDDTDDESVTITHRAASSDAGYDGIAVASVAVSVTDTTPQQQQQTAEPVEIPGPVVNLQLTAKGEKVIVTWQAPQSGGAVDNYIAHIKPAGGGDGKTHRPRAGKTTTTFGKLEAGATYRVWVRAQNEAGKGERVHARITLPDGVVRGGEGDPPPEQQQTDTTPPEQESEEQETEPPVPRQTEPYNVQVTPGDGTLTVTWTVAPREGFEVDEIRHALRWSQEPGVWANPAGPNAAGPNDGVSVEGGVYTYTITGLRNGVATGVFIRSFTGGNHNEGSPTSSRWVRLKGEDTTPGAAE